MGEIRSPGETLYKYLREATVIITNKYERLITAGVVGKWGF